MDIAWAPWRCPWGLAGRPPSAPLWAPAGNCPKPGTSWCSLKSPSWFSWKFCATFILTQRPKGKVNQNGPRRCEVKQQLSACALTSPQRTKLRSTNKGGTRNKDRWERKCAALMGASLEMVVQCGTTSLEATPASASPTSLAHFQGETLCTCLLRMCVPALDEQTK